MYYGPYAPWEHYPKNLRHSEVLNPLIVVADFFDAASPKEHIARLRRWHHYVIYHNHFKDKRHGMSKLLSIHDENIRLLEAMDLLLLSYTVSREQDICITVERLIVEKESWKYFPYNLSEKHLISPYKAVAKVFKQIPPQQYREHLNEWLHAALSKHPIDENIEASEVYTVLDNLLKLYAAAWLIFKRNGVNPAIYQSL
jgi:hypothetical protein